MREVIVIGNQLTYFEVLLQRGFVGLIVDLAIGGVVSIAREIIIGLLE